MTTNLFRTCPSCHGSGLIPVDWQNARCYDLKDCPQCGREGILSDQGTEWLIANRAQIAEFLRPQRQTA